MIKDWMETIKFPAVIEGKNGDGEWRHIVKLETIADLSYKMNAYRLPVYDEMRIRDSAETCNSIFRERLYEFNKKATQTAITDTAHLNKFLKSAPEQALQTAGELVKAGLHAKHFHIRDNSKVLLDSPDLHALMFHEFDKMVVCKVLVTDAPITEMEPTITLWKKPIKIGTEQHAFSTSPDNLDDKVCAFLILLAASIVRDFWVLDERARGRKYEKRTEKTRTRVGQGAERKLVVSKEYIFIPRFRYALASNRSASEVSHSVRVRLSPHLVSGHLRLLREGHRASDGALAQAPEFGLQVPNGYTFVRPHERGSDEDLMHLRTYRSCSALQLIFGEATE